MTHGAQEEEILGPVEGAGERHTGTALGGKIGRYLRV